MEWPVILTREKKHWVIKTLDSNLSENNCKTSKFLIVPNQASIFHTIFSGQEKWCGTCLDTKAQTTVNGLQQAKPYCKLLGIDHKLQKNSNKYIFGEEKTSFSGIIYN